MAQFTTKQDLYKFVSAIRERYGIKICSYPLNLIEMCEERNNLDIEYLDIKTKGLCGIAFIGTKADTIVLNVNRNQRERNYDCAHEVVHLLKHRHLGMAEFKCYENSDLKQNTALEWQANEGAAEILVPYRQLLPLIYDNRHAISSQDEIYNLKLKLADFFNVTESVIKFRFESLKYEINQFLNGCHLDNLEIVSATKQKQFGIKIKSLNDIANHTIESNLFSDTLLPEFVTEDERELLDNLKFGTAYY